MRHGDRQYENNQLFHNIRVLCFVAILFLSSMLTCSTAESKDTSDPIYVKVGYVLDSFSGVSIEDARIAIRLLFESRFARKYPGQTGELLLYQDMDSALESLRKKEINALGASTLDYIKTKDMNNLLPVRMGKLGDSAKASFVFIVRRGQASSLPMLKDKTLIIESAGNGKVASMWGDTILLSESLPESRVFFKSIDRIKKESQAVLKVFFDKADACIIQKRTYDVMKELNPQLESQLQVMYESPPFLMGLFMVVKDIDERTKQFILTVIDEMGMDNEGARILSMFRVKGVSQFKPEYLETIETLYKSYLRLKKDCS